MKSVIDDLNKQIMKLDDDIKYYQEEAASQYESHLQSLARVMTYKERKSELLNAIEKSGAK